MKLIPILFSTPMVQAILSGNKSMTRRKCKYQYWSFHELIDVNKNGITQKVDREVSCPYGQPGDVLWVREKFCNINFPEIDPEYYFFTQALDAEDYDPKEWTWKPSIHMPFEACRIFLRVKEIRVERLQDITQKDAICEGIILANNLHFDVPASITIWKDYTSEGNYFQREDYSFRSLWISINGADSWNANPWVWVISFERITDGNEIAAIRKQWNEKHLQKTN